MTYTHEHLNRLIARHLPSRTVAGFTDRGVWVRRIVDLTLDDGSAVILKVRAHPEWSDPTEKEAFIADLLMQRILAGAGGYLEPKSPENARRAQSHLQELEPLIALAEVERDAAALSLAGGALTLSEPPCLPCRENHRRDRLLRSRITRHGSDGSRIASRIAPHISLCIGGA